MKLTILRGMNSGQINKRRSEKAGKKANANIHCTHGRRKRTGMIRGAKRIREGEKVGIIMHSALCVRVCA